MESRQEKLKKLREQYIRRSGDKLDQIARFIDQIERNPSDAVPLNDMMRHFHGLAGSGSNYGFPNITVLGLQGEHECVALIRKRLNGGPKDLRRLKTLLDELRIELSRGGTNSMEGWDNVAQPGSKPCDVLVVDDEDDICVMLSSLLEQEAMLVRSAHNKTDGLRALKDQMPDAAIIDIGLPDGSGYEVVEHLRRLPRGEHTAVLMVSVLTDFLDKVEAIRCGADGYFEKPLDLEALMRRLRNLLERTKTESLRILSVEDDTEQASLLQSVLESAGYQVGVCHDPKHFDTHLISFAPDLVLMDVLLPGISGYDLARYLRQDERYATLPILFLTVQGQAQAKLEGILAGADDHLVKPISPEVLLSTVAARIQRSRFLKSMMDRDGLTRLLTHRAFLDRAQAVVRHKLRNPQNSSALAMIDLDHFKSVNDCHGHLIGDRVLVSLSRLLQVRLRQTDIIGRMGGDEFAVLIDDIRLEEAVRLVSRLREEFSLLDEENSAGHVFRVTFSAGLVMLDPKTMNVEHWLKAADAALYAAKEAGRNIVICPAETGGD